MRARTLVPILALCLLALFFCAGAQAAGGTAIGWGTNAFGQLGNGTSTPVTTDPCGCIRAPAPVSGLSGVTQIVGGGEHTLALLASGVVMAWGQNERGELGTGGFSGPETCGTAACSTVPIPVPGLANVVAIAAGNEHNLALLANGTVMAWGKNSRGQLGNGESSDFSGPETCGGVACSTVPIPVPGLTNVVAVAARNLDSLALLANGTVMAWGLNSLGETGDGVGTPDGCFCIDHPVPVPGVSGALAIAAGSNAGYASLPDGTVKAWGANNSGQLGVGAVSPQGGCECLGPVSVRGLTGVRAITAGGNHALALLSQGNVQAWGDNSHGQLGNGSTTPSTTDPCECIPAPVLVGGVSGSTTLGAGNNHSLMLLSGGIEAWGSNQAGQLGDGTVEDRSAPTAVGAIGGASSVSAGANASFALIGPSQALKVSQVGAGSGTVGTQGILCPPSCEARYPQSQVEILRPEPSPGSGFAGFSGPCTGTAPCQAKLDQDQTVTATFGPPKGTAITKAKLSSRKKSASFDFTAPGAITGFECELIRPKPARKAHKPKGHRRFKHAAHKQPKPRFSSCATPKTFKHLKPGRYTFKVRALDILGADANPALKRFTIKAHKSKKPKPKR